MSSIKPKIMFRADGDSKIGLGHMIRSNALASLVKEDYDCIMLTRCTVPGILEELKSTFTEVRQLQKQDYYSEARNFSTGKIIADIIILDGYEFDSTYQQILIGKNYDLFCIDDIHAYKFFSRVVINHSGGLTPLDYEAQPFTQFYLGPQYALLRHAFLEASKKRRTVVDNKTCFVCFGGADPENKTLEILQNKTICKYFDHFHVVTGNAYNYQDELNHFSTSKKNISLHRSLSAEEMVSVMQQCSFAICSPSTVVYEYMSAGGIVFLEQIAENQKDVIKFMVDERLAFRLDELEKIDANGMRDSLDRQATYFDGNSGDRFKKLFRQYFESKRLKIRKAEISDLATCFNWANDPDVRSQSYNQNQITPEEHRNWFTTKLSDSGSFFYILEIDQKPIAQIRFQVNDHEAILSYLADKTIRNKGIGTTILGKGIEIFINEYNKPVSIVGFVKQSNVVSQRSFERLAFIKTDSTEYPDSFKYIMRYDN